jgi:hypothetical protein
MAKTLALGFYEELKFLFKKSLWPESQSILLFKPYVEVNLWHSILDHIQHINQHTPNARCQVLNDCAGVEELNVATIYMMVFLIYRPFHRFHAWMCRGECAMNFTVRCQISWALLNLLGATKSAGQCELHNSLPKLLGTVNFTVRYLSSWVLWISQCTTKYGSVLPKLWAHLEETLHKLATQWCYQKTPRFKEFELSFWWVADDMEKRKDYR